jgi:hypothetical protein
MVPWSSLEASVTFPKRTVLFALALAAAASIAEAHPRPRTTSPSAGAVLRASPGEIRMGFSEGVVAAFSKLELKDAAGKSVPLGPTAVDPKNKTQLFAPVKVPLKPGAYTVSWRAVGDDTHHVSGQYGFQVKP